MTEAKSAQNWNPGDCPMCGSNCAGGAHRKALAEDGIETSEQYQAMKNESAQPSPDSDGPCWKCGHPCECWFTDSRLWNKVNGGETGLLCLRCFIEIAETMGLKSCAWRLVPDVLEGQNSGDAVAKLRKVCDETRR